MACEQDCIVWPCPDLGCECIPAGVQPAQIARALRQANQCVYDQTNRRFNGCGCVARLRPCTMCRCGPCVCDPCKTDRIDLHQKIRYPIHEILAIHLDGKSQPLDGWRIDGRRYLVRPAGKSWPQQSLQLGDGEECTWSITVRYGTPAPYDVIQARNQLFMQELEKCGKGGLGKCGDSKLIETTDKAGTHRLAQETDWIECVRERYGRRRARSMYIDPAGRCDPYGDVVEIVRTPEPRDHVYTQEQCNPEAWAMEVAARLVSANPPVPGGELDQFGLRVAGC